jgi:hypothetical protein
MSNFVIARAGAGKLGSVGAAEAAASDVGSIAKVEFSYDRDVYEATDASAGDMVVEQELGPTKCGLKLTLQEFTAANVARALGTTFDGTGIANSDSNTPAYFSGYFHGFKIGGVPHLLHIVRGSIKPSALMGLGGSDQKELEVEVTVMTDPDSTYGYSAFKFIRDVADTTPPTISSVSPANGATAVAKAITTPVVVTFDGPVRTEDITDKTVQVFASAGTIKAGTLVVSAAGVVTFTPTTAWAASTAYTVVVVRGIRDVAGNALAATQVTTFTTGA